MSKLVFPLIVVIAGALLTFYLNKKSSILIYSITDPIPAEFQDGDTSKIQQLTVVNDGDLASKNIRVSVSENLSQIKLYPHVNSISSQFARSENSFDLNYGDLPPNESFKIVVKSNSPVSESSLVIVSDEGRASNALKGKSKPLTDSLLSLLPPLIYITLIFWQARKFTISTYKTSSDTPERTKKPWFFSLETWQEVFKESVEHKIKNEFKFITNEVSESFTFKFLDQTRSQYLKESDWDELIKIAQEKLASTIMKSLYTRYSFSNIIDEFPTKRPNNFKESEWQKLQNEVSKIYVLKESQVYIPLSERESRYTSLLKQPRPQVISSDDWKIRQNYLGEAYLYFVCEKIFNSEDLARTLSEVKIDELPESSYKDGAIREIINFIRMTSLDFEACNAILGMQRPSWIADSEFRRIKNLASENFKTLTELRDAKEILKAAEEMISRKPISVSTNNPISEKIKQIDQKLEQLLDDRDDVASQRKKLATEILKTNEIREKVTKQLDKINEIFSNSATISRIETYDDLFSSGNWEILKKLSNFIHKNP